MRVPEAVKPGQFKGGKVVIVVDGLDEVDLDAQRGDDSNVLFLPRI